MAEFKIPELGENITQGDVVKVSVKVGDTIQKDQTVLELETDKAVVEVPSSFSGSISKIAVKEGDQVKVGQVVFEYEGGTETSKEPVKSEPAPKKEVVKEVQKEELPKTELKPVPKPKKEDIVNTQSQPVAVQEFASPDKKSVSSAYASPSVRRLAREIGVDIEQVVGSGSKGRITEDDVKNHARKENVKVQKSVVVPNDSGPNIELPDFSKWGSIERKPMSSVRRKTATHLSQAWYVPHVTQFDKADITELERLRKNFAKRAEAAGGKLTLTVIVLKIVASALKVFPQFNASVDMSTNEVIFKNYYHIGVAADTDRGLLVPVVRDVEKKNIVQLSVELNKAAEAARNRKLTLDDMQGGTFTISNLGGLGGTYFTPIINTPEVAILGLSRGRMEPVYVDGQFEPRLMLPLSLSYDHRLIDGADAVRFLRWIAEAIEQPFLMDLEG